MTVSEPPLVVVSHALAPGPGGPEADVTRRLVDALRESWDRPVFCVSAGRRAPSDHPDLDLRLGGEDALRRTGTINAWLGRLADEARRRRLSLGRVVHRGLFELTGVGLESAVFERAAAHTTRALLEDHPGAVVCSRALPLASVSAAARALRGRRERWWVNFNDPCPPSLLAGIAPSLEAAGARLEARMRRVVSRIDCWSAPCRRLLDLQGDAFPELGRRPSAVLPHLAPPTPASPPRHPWTPPLEIAFAGNLFGARSRNALPQAVARLQQRRPDLAGALRFTFHLASRLPAAEAFVRSLGDGCELRPLEGAADLSGADVLLDLEGELNRPLLASKLAHYLAHGKPILALCPRGGTAWELLTDHGGGFVCPYDSADEIATALEQILQIARAGRLDDHRPSATLRARFSVERFLADLRRLLARDRASSGLVSAAWP